MDAKLFKLMVWIGIIILIVSSACDAATDLPTPEIDSPPSEPPPTETPVVTEEVISSPEPVDNLQEVKEATIKIESQGTFIDPEFGSAMKNAGRGSGFIIDPSGIAITNHHVVTGATQLKVWVGRETAPRNAKVLGVSECSNLAVIDIDGEGFDYLDWYQHPIEVGMDIFIAGFLLEDLGYSLTKGVLSNDLADGETPWASVESVIEYAALSSPGNSGGPVVDSNAEVIGVHYGGDALKQRAVGISQDVAKDIIEKISADGDLNNFGVNGQAVTSEDGSVAGIWVSSVQPGSPADQTGIQPGDIITKLENLFMATDGTMNQYCDILSSHNPGDTLSVQVLRWSSGDILEGQINGQGLVVVKTGVGRLETTPGVSGNDIVNPDASQSGDVYFSTNFDGGLGGWFSYLMTESSPDSFTAQTISDRLQINIVERDTWAYFIYSEIDFADVKIDVIAENLGNNNNNVSLICRESELGWYEFNIANNGLYYIYWFDDANVHNYIPLFSGGSRKINMGKDINEYSAVCDGDQLTLIINGEEIRTVRDNHLESGKVGLSVSSFDFYPVIIEFDHFTASVP